MDLLTTAAQPVTSSGLREYGLQQNVPVFFFPGSLGALMALDDVRAEQLAQRHQLRLLVADDPLSALPLMAELQHYGIVGFSWGAADALRAAAKSSATAAVGLISPLPDLSVSRLRAASLHALAPLLAAAEEVRDRAWSGSGWHEFHYATSPALRRLWASLPAADRRTLRPLASAGSWRRLTSELDARALAFADEVDSIKEPWGLDLSEVRAPVELLSGGADPWSSDEVAHWFKQSLPHCRVRRVEGTGHFSVLVDHCGPLLDSVGRQVHQRAD